MDGIQGRRPFPAGVEMAGASPREGQEAPGAGSPGSARSPVPAHQIVPPLGHTPLSRAGAHPADAAFGAGRTVTKPATAQRVREVAPPLAIAAPRTERS